jgi:hydroxybutyrate-dimer hydrolase
MKLPLESRLLPSPLSSFSPSLARTVIAIGIGGFAAGCAQLSIPSPMDFFKPSIVIPSESEISARTYDGKTDDLLTAGLGKTGLGLAQPPAAADPSNPSPRELRQRAIHANYRALLDGAVTGGYGRFFGPNIDLNGQDTLGEGKVAGDEYIALVKDREGNINATVMVQIPAAFNLAKPCIVTATSSGSRGIYGAIGTAGEWGLKKGCAVAYTDKATGTGVHDLATDRVYLADGQRSTAASAGSRSTFTVNLTGSERREFADRSPNRFAFKQAHSQQNVERLWGEFTLAAVEFAFERLNKLQDSRKGDYNRNNTTVIASSLSNGAYAALMAAEQDRSGLIDGIVATEPNVSLRYNAQISIKQGSGEATKVHSRSLLDYTTVINLFAPCAALDASLVGAPLNIIAQPLRAARCESLAAKGLLKATTLEGQAAESVAVLKAHGLQQEGLMVQPGQYALGVPQAIAVTYAMAYGRFSVIESLCGYSFAATEPAAAGVRTGMPAAHTGGEWLFASSNGIAPTGGISLISEQSVGGARDDRLATSDSTKKQDLNIDGAICLREVATGAEVGVGGSRGNAFAPGSVRFQQAARVAKGIEETIMTANLQGKPTIIVSPRSDGLLPINHAGRAYFANNVAAFPKTASNIRLYEVTNAQHLDVLNGIPGFDAKFIPTHVYFTQAMNLMWAHLADKKALPPSQVIRTSPRELKDAKAVPLTLTNIPAIAVSPAPDAVISFSNNTLIIPE